MTAQEIITKFRVMVDDSLDSDYELELLNDAINEIEGLRDWEILKKETSFKNMTGYTDTRDLPSDFYIDSSVFDDSDNKYNKYLINDRYSKINNSDGFFLDLANNKIGLTGTSLNISTIYLNYISKSSDLGINDSWSFPSNFHKILAYQMAELYYPSDAGEKSRAWDDRWNIRFEKLLASMETWDSRLKTINYQSIRTPYNEKKLNNL